MSKAPLRSAVRTDMGVEVAHEHHHLRESARRDSRRRGRAPVAPCPAAAGIRPAPSRPAQRPAPAPAAWPGNGDSRCACRCPGRPPRRIHAPCGYGKTTLLETIAAIFLRQQGTLAFCHDQLDEARRLLRQALTLREQIGDDIGAGITRHNLQLLEPPDPPRRHGARCHAAPWPWQALNRASISAKVPRASIT